MNQSTMNLIRSMSAMLAALQDGYEDEDRWGEADEAINQVNRDLHRPDIDPDVAALATNALELGFALND